MKVESEKVDLKLNIQKTKIMVFGPITSWEIDGKQWKQCQTLFFWGSKITADGDCSHEIKRRLLLGRTSLVAQMVKHLSTMLETWVQSLGWEDPLEKEMAIHSKTCLENSMDRGAW